MRKIITQSNYLENRDNLRTHEYNSGLDIVDRSDYISPDVQYYRLAQAGITLTNARKDMFDLTDEYTTEMLTDLVRTDKMFNKFTDKLEVAENYKAKLKQFQKFKNDREYLESLRDRYLAEIKQKELKEAIQKELKKEVSSVPTRDKVENVAQ